MKDAMNDAMRKLALCLLLSAAPAAAEPREGAIVFARFGSVFQQPADLSQPPVAIAELPDDATEVKWLEPIRNGHLVVVNLADYPVWVYAPDPGMPALLRGGPCTGRAHPNPWGGCLACATREGQMLVSAGPRVDQAKIPLDLEDVAFLGDSGLELAGRAPDNTLVGFNRKDPQNHHVLAKIAPRSHLLFSPDGKKAVGVFGEGDAARVRSFLLDGEGVSRQLGGPGFPTVWSWDSTWIFYQEGDIKMEGIPDEGDESGMLEAPIGDRFLVAAAPRRRKPAPKKRGKPKGKPKAEPSPSGPLIRACVARATGGEVKCWEGYTGLAFSPDSTLVLLKKDKSLYVGKIAGVRPDPPVKIMDDIDGAATWVPGLIAAPMPPPDGRP